jgi:hypothetical protein
MWFLDGGNEGRVVLASYSAQRAVVHIWRYIFKNAKVGTEGGELPLTPSPPLTPTAGLRISLGAIPN